MDLWAACMIIDEIVPEPAGGAHRYPDVAAASLGDAIGRALDEVGTLEPNAIVEARSQRFRRMGVFLEDASDPDASRRAKADAKERTRIYKAARALLEAGKPATSELLTS